MQLAALLRNQTARVDERDDAAMDLGESSEPEALNALMAVATSVEESEVLQASAGESVAMIWLRSGLFRRELLDRLTPVARSEAEALIRRERPLWLAEAET